jgi:hypothetical protein
MAVSTVNTAFPIGPEEVLGRLTATWEERV